MAPTYTSAIGSYGFMADYAEAVDILYSYVEKDPHIDYVPVAYSYNDGAAGRGRVIGKRAAATQELMNNLPEWMAMRKEHDSTGQTLAHAWGANLEDANDAFSSYRKDQFLATADVYPDIHMGVSELSFSEEKVYSSDIRNLLFNTSFSMEAFSRSQRPEGWAVSRSALSNLVLSKDEAIYGRNAVRLVDSVELRQSRELRVQGGDLTLSCYVKTESDTGESTSDQYDASLAGLILVLHYADNSVDSYGVGFPKNTEGDWSRLGLSVSMKKELSSFQVIIANRISTAYVVDLPMLENSKVVRPWSPSIEDVPVYLNAPYKSVTGVQIVPSVLDNQKTEKIELFELASDQEFENVAVPTRILPYFPQKDPGNTVNLALGRQVNYFGEKQPTMWVAEDGKITEKSLTTPDVFGIVQPRDLYKDENGDLWLDESLSDANLVVKAATVLGPHMLLVTRESYAGKTSYYLKVAKPDKVLYEDTFVESLADLEIPIKLNNIGFSGASEDIARIGVCKNLPGVIFIDTTLDRRFYYKLVFDYYYADFGVRKIYCRESYADHNAHLQIL